LVHGFNVWDGGRQSVGKLRPFFADKGMPYVMVNYGHFGLLDTRFKNDKIAKLVAEASHNAINAGYQVIAVGHSNGAAIIHRATTRYNASIDRAVYINPALKKDLAPGAQVRRVDVWHSPSDKPVQWAKWLPASNARPWGEMGALGYEGADNRMVNLNKEHSFLAISREHSDMFKADKLTYFGPLLVRTAMESL
jgi:alpha-beta hydrolase superfamily lysophospholipase